MELKDLGRKEPRPTSPGEATQEDRIIYPLFSLTGDKIPEELGNAKLEEMRRCEIIIKKVGDSIDIYAKGQPRRVELEIHKLGYIGKAGKMSKEEYLKASDEEREKNDLENMEEEPEKGEE